MEPMKTSVIPKVSTVTNARRGSHFKSGARASMSSSTLRTSSSLSSTLSSTAVIPEAELGRRCVFLVCMLFEVFFVGLRCCTILSKLSLSSSRVTAVCLRCFFGCFFLCATEASSSSSFVLSLVCPLRDFMLEWGAQPHTQCKRCAAARGVFTNKYSNLETHTSS